MYAIRLLESVRHELERVDTKAALLLATLGLVIGAFISAILQGDWSPSMLGTIYESAWWLGATLVLAGIVLLLLAIFPRGRVTSRPTRVTYFGEIAKTPLTDLDGALRRTIDEGLEPQLLHLHASAVLVQRKFALLRAALQCLSTGVVACALALLAHAVA